MSISTSNAPECKVYGYILSVQTLISYVSMDKSRDDPSERTCSLFGNEPSRTLRRTVKDYVDLIRDDAWTKTRPMLAPRFAYYVS
jgi:hypothetical protein